MDEFIPERVRARRKELCMTQKELAEKSGLSTVTVSLIEKRKKEPRAGTISKIAAALGADIGYFFGRRTNYS